MAIGAGAHAGEPGCIAQIEGCADGKVTRKDYFVWSVRNPSETVQMLPDPVYCPILGSAGRRDELSADSLVEATWVASVKKIIYQQCLPTSFGLY